MLADHDWTPDLTAERLIQAFRLLPGRGVYAPVTGGMLDIIGQRITGLVIIRLAQDCLGPRSHECVQLLTWARVKATDGLRWDASINEICRELGWSRSSFDRHQHAGLERLSDHLQAEKARLLALLTPS